MMIFDEFVLHNSLTLSANLELVEVSTTSVLPLADSQITELRAQLALRNYLISTGTLGNAITNSIDNDLLQAAYQALIDVYLAYDNAIRVSEAGSELVDDPLIEPQLQTTLSTAIEAVKGSASFGSSLTSTGACYDLFVDAESALTAANTENATTITLAALTDTLKTAISDMGTALDNLTEAITGGEVDNWSVIKSQFDLATA
ncbi:hypothetical protein U2F10_34940 [Leptothoe sp. EHU-05/26/07-4]